MKNLSIYLALAALIFLASRAFSDLADGGAGYAREFDDGERIIFDDFDLRRWPEDGFFESVVSRVDALSVTHASDRSAVMLDLSEIYLSHMLISEADSFIEAAAELNGAVSDRYFALQDAINLLRGRTVQEFGASPLVGDHRPDKALWKSLYALANNESDLLRDNLEAALIALGFQSRTVAVALLPVIAEASIDLGEVRVSQAALELMDTVPELSESSTIQYLWARHHESQRDQKSALEDYFSASQGWDRDAARARVALADLAIADGSNGALLAARDVLSYGAGAWRGDATEIAVLERQGIVSGILNDPVEALMAYRRILTRHPNSLEATKARRAAVEHFTKIYNNGRDGEIGLSYWYTLHQILLPAYRFLPEFPSFNEILADTVFEMGGMDLAMSEYQQILGIYDEWPDSQNGEPQTEDYNRIFLKLARAQLRAGLRHAAIKTLARIDSRNQTDLTREIDGLRAQAMSDLGEFDQLLGQFMNDPDAPSLRVRSKALFVNENWFGASDLYLKLWETFPNEFRLSDASYLLIAAYRANNLELAQKVVQAFPDLTESDDIASLAEGLLRERASLFPLRDTNAFERLESANETIRLLQRSGVSP